MMFVAEGSLIVAANARQLYDCMVDPARLDIVMGGGLAEVEGVQALPGGGYTFRCAHRWEKFPIWAQGATTVLVPGQRIVLESMGGIDMISAWLFETEGSSTRVTFTIEIPETGLLIPRIAPQKISRQIRESIDSSLASVQKIASQVASQPLGQFASAS